MPAVGELVRCTNGSQMTGWKVGTAPRPDHVRAAARAYDTDALELMRIAYLSDDEVKKRTPKSRT